MIPRARACPLTCPVQVQVVPLIMWQQRVVQRQRDAVGEDQDDHHQLKVWAVADLLSQGPYAADLRRGRGRCGRSCCCCVRKLAVCFEFAGFAACWDDLQADHCIDSCHTKRCIGWRGCHRTPSPLSYNKR